jgi:hypothetical protein
VAEVTKSVIGKLSGTLGNMVFRNIGDKVVIYMRPHNQRISYSENSVKNRGKFGLTSLLATKSKLLPGIKEVWDSTNLEGRSAYTKLIKANAKSTAADRLTINNNITPMGDSLFVNSYSLNIQKFDIEYKFEGKGIEKIQPPYNANLLIFLYDIKNPEAGREHYFVTDSRVVNEESITEYTNLEIVLNNAYTTLIPLYNKAIIFFTVTKAKNKDVHWTTNFKAEVDL